MANAISTELFYVEYTSASAIRNREGIPGKELKLTRRALKISTRQRYRYVCVVTNKRTRAASPT